MATKKSSTSRKIKTTKIQRVDHATHTHFGKYIAMLGIVIAMLLFGVFYLLGQKKSYADEQKILAFRGVVETMIDRQFEIEGERGASVTGIGMTNDHDLYADFVIQKYEDHVPQSYQKARIHFQCHEQDSLKLKKDGCSHAYWYGDEVETTAEFRAKYQAYLDEINRLVDEYNATPESDATTRDAIKKQEQKLYNEYKSFFDDYKALLGA